MFDAGKGFLARELMAVTDHTGTGDTSSSANVDITDLQGHAKVVANVTSGGTTDIGTITVHDDNDNVLATFDSFAAADTDFFDVVHIDLQKAEGGKVYGNITADGSTDTFTITMSLVAHERYAS